MYICMYVCIYVYKCIYIYIYIYIYMCPDEEKGCSARDWVIIVSCRAENLL